jgi:hypothetical protein
MAKRLDDPYLSPLKQGEGEKAAASVARTKWAMTTERCAPLNRFAVMLDQRERLVEMVQ